LLVSAWKSKSVFTLHDIEVSNINVCFMGLLCHVK